jgi:hypothetical protein
LISDGLRKTGIQVDRPDFRHSLLEVWLSRGDRRLADVIETAWKNGAKFDAWNENFDSQKWLSAFQTCNIDPEFYASRAREMDEILPWDHISSGISKNFLIREYKKSRQGEISPDCRSVCHACGIQSNFMISCSELRTRA